MDRWGCCNPTNLNKINGNLGLGLELEQGQAFVIIN